MTTPVNNCLSVDIETWAYGDTPEMRNLTSAERKALDNGYVLESMKQVLALLKEYDAHITMFIVGQQIEWYPELPDMILSAGHELGLHSYVHYPIRTAEDLRRDLEKAAPFIQKYGIHGYRAPLIYLPEGGFEILREFGFTFDSSVYGPYSLAGKYSGVAEVPISSLRFKSSPAVMALPRHLAFSIMLSELELPFGSSYFTGLFATNTAALMRRVNRASSPAVVFLHNWQIFPPHNASFPPKGYLLRNPTYWPLTRNLEPTVRKILSEFRIDKMGQLAKGILNSEQLLR